jgi:hypothetical protein
VCTDPLYTLTEISDACGISISSVRDISAERTHKWLFTSKYNEFLVAKALRNSNKRSAKAQGITYPTILSPEGTEYEVTNVTKFSQEHGLSRSALGRVLTGWGSKHKGWKLK